MCVFPTVKLNFLFQKPIEQGSAFFVSTIFGPEAANSVYFLLIRHLKLRCRNHAKGYGQLRGQH